MTMIHKKIDEYDVFLLDDGIDYWSLFQKVIKGEIESKALHHQVPEHRNLLFEDGGRKYVLKFHDETLKHWDVKLFLRLFGSRCLRIMENTHRAIAEGCDIIQQIYMVAEKRIDGLADQSIMLVEYLPGHSLWEEADVPAFHQQIINTMLTLHRHRLTMIDVHPGNFIVQGDRLLAIDLLFQGSFRFDRAKEVVRAKKRFGIDVPVPGILDRIIVSFTWQKRRFFAWRRRRKNRR